jgi:hypothetical protein
MSTPGPRALSVARAALRVAPLQRIVSGRGEAKGWALQVPHRRARRFSAATVNALIAQGEAVRCGDVVRAAACG